MNDKATSKQKTTTDTQAAPRVPAKGVMFIYIVIYPFTVFSAAAFDALQLSSVFPEFYLELSRQVLIFYNG